MRCFVLLCLCSAVGCGSGDGNVQWEVDDAQDNDAPESLDAQYGLIAADDVYTAGGVLKGSVAWVFQDAARQCGTYTLPTPNPSGTCRVAHATVRNFDQTVHVGAVDVSACVARIVHGYKLPFRHDGTVFRNDEHLLPEAPRDFYHEYVDPTPGLKGPGPQRLIRGGKQAWYYTPDHYATFLPINCTLNVAR